MHCKNTTVCSCGTTLMQCRCQGQHEVVVIQNGCSRCKIQQHSRPTAFEEADKLCARKTWGDLKIAFDRAVDSGLIPSQAEAEDLLESVRIALGI